MAIQSMDKIVCQIRPCYQCGTCAGGCPVFRNNPDLNPRMLIEKLLFGQIDKILQNQDVWNCCFCLTCSQHCPQSVDLAHILIELKNYSAKEGITPKSILDEMKILKKTGMTFELSKMVLKRRKKMNLPGILPPDLNGIQKILKTTGFDDRLNSSLAGKQITETSEEEA
ncbi:MAG: 4Fe-4S dicluster domain-containing protein [Candidatus Bathyarchaeota archaeon]|nr:MAG: 4Fe-4S dicluster domain-containing protein [Candidatus Bathyarchaeota archaeon]